MFIPDSIQFPLQDQFQSVWKNVAASKIADTRVEPAQIISYDPLTHTARVAIMRGGYTTVGIVVRGAAHYQDAVPGTGEQAAHYPGQVVDVAFLQGSSTGLYNQGQIVSTKYTHDDHHAVASIPFQSSKSGTVITYPNATGGWGNSHHVDNQSNVNTTTIGKVNKEDWSNEHVIGNGSNKTRSEELTQKSASSVMDAANTLLES